MEKDIHYIELKLLNIRLRFSSKQTDLIEVIRYFTDIAMKEPEMLEPHIVINFNLNTSHLNDKNENKLARNLWIGDSSVFISEIERFPGLRLHASLREDKLYIDAFLEEKPSHFLESLLYSLRHAKRNMHFKLIGLVYYLVYFPYLYYLERFRNLYLLHAGAVQYKQQGIILAGLGGVGKSTFSLGLLALDESKMLSDNLIFHDTRKIYSFPEPITLNPDMTNILGQIENFLISKNIASTHERMYYQVKPEVFSQEVVPKYLFWLQWGKENKIVSIEKAACVRNLLNINLLAKELREYYVLAAMFDLAFADHALASTAYADNLAALLSGLDCYILQFKPGADIATVFNETLARVIA